MAQHRRIVALALLAGLVAAVSPQTSTHLRYSLAGGVLVALGVLVLALLWARRASRADPRPTLAPPPPRVALALAAVAAAFALSGDWLLAKWSESIFRNSYGAFVPLLMLLLARAALRRDPSPEPAASPAGFAFVGLGLALLVLDAGLRLGYAAALGIAVCLPGLSLLLLGARRTRRLAFPLALGLFLVPLPNVFASPLGLRDVTAAGTSRVLHWIGVPHLLERTLVRLRDESIYLVSDNCAGFQLILAGFVMAIVLALWIRSTPHRLLLFAAVVPVAIVANVLRTALLMVLTHQWGERALQVPLVHGGTGIFAFWLLFLVLLVLANPRRLLREAWA